MIESDPQSGVRNMATDEALLERAIERGECSVRWYRWEAATVSLGYFQSSTALAASPRLAALPVVRRLTGGGAILHHHEWTYSCTVPSDHPLAKTPSRLYELVHGRIVACLHERGIEASLRGASAPEREAMFLCFGRGDPRDVVLQGYKIVGSAQRRRRGAVLQHGSVLLRRSEFAPQFPGILDLAPAESVDEQFFRRAAEAIGGLFGAVRLAAGHDPSLLERIDRLEDRYESLEWSRTGERATGRTGRRSG